MKLPRSCVTMCCALAAVLLGDLDLAREDQHQPGASLTDSREHVAGLIAARLAETGEPRQLIVA